MILTRLKEWRPDRHACSVDPISGTLALTALGGALGLGGAAAAGAFGGGGPQTPTTPTTPATSIAQPVTQPVSTPQGTPSGTPKPQAPTFLGAAATPPVQSGSKTLLGA